jgi:hypothetical protein
VSSRPDLHELARRVLRDSPGDGLGLAFDLEAQLDIAETSAVRWLACPSPELLAEWRDVMAAVGDAEGAVGSDARSRLDALRLLLEVVEDASGVSSDPSVFRGSLARLAEKRLHGEPERAAGVVGALGGVLLSLAARSRTAAA